MLWLIKLSQVVFSQMIEPCLSVSCHSRDKCICRIEWNIGSQFDVPKQMLCSLVIWIEMCHYIIHLVTRTHLYWWHLLPCSVCKMSKDHMPCQVSVCVWHSVAVSMCVCVCVFMHVLVRAFVLMCLIKKIRKKG